MTAHVLFHAAPFLLSSLFIAGLLYATRHRRLHRTARWFRVLMALAACWSIVSGAHLLVSATWAKLFSVNVKYLFVVFLPVAWVMLAFAYSGFERLLNRVVVAILSAVPTATLFLLATNSFHHLVFKSDTLYANNGVVTVAREYGSWFSVHTLYSYVLVSIGLILFIWHYFTTQGNYKRQAATVVLAAFFPFLFNAVYLCFPSFFHHLDYTPVTFAVSGVLFSIGFFRFGLSDFVPIARAEIMRGLRDPVIVIDSEDYLVDINKAAIERFGILDGDYAGFPLREVLPHLDGPLEQIRNARRQRDEIMFTEADGDAWFDCSIHDVCKASGQHRGSIVVLREITEMKRVETELKKAKNRAEESSRMKTAFLANMSHEIRTPLAGVIGMAEILSRETSGEHQEFSRMIESGARRLLDMLESIIDVSLLAAGDIKVNSESTDLCDLCKTTAQKFDASTRENNLDLIVHVDDVPVVCNVDPKHTRRILHHLLENAIKFTFDGHVTLIVSRELDRAVIRIEDTGMGIEPEILPHIYDAFTQAEIGTNRKAEGTGLGLHLVKGLIDEMGGTIRIASTLGVGTICTVSFPLDCSENTASEEHPTFRLASGASFE